MSDRITNYDNPGNGRDLSQTLWQNAPLQTVRENPGKGLCFEDDFMANYADLTDGGYVVSQATSGTFASGTEEGGVAVADPGAATATQGPNIQVDGAQFLPAAGKKIYCEARIKASAITSGINFFLGLAEVDTTVIATNAISTANHVGFSSVTADGILLFNSEKAGAGDTGACHTLVAGEYVKLGFLIDGVDSIKQFVNGVETGTAKVTANIPIVNLVPTLVVQAKGTQNTVTIDFWKFFQVED